MGTAMTAVGPLASRPRLTAVRLELAKMRRLRTVPVAAALVAATVALSGTSLFSDSVRAGFSAPDSHVWEELLLSCTLMSAITGPILAAVLASRQTDIEHSGAGWTLFATAGRTPGALCRAKVVALSLVIAPAITCQSLALVGSALLAGVTVPLSPGPWALYTAELIAVDLVMCAFHVWLAAIKENQLIGVGVGLLGSFVAVYMLLLPSWAAHLVPWGYYAVISCARVGTVEANAHDALYTTPPLGWVVAFLILAAALFTAATRRLDRIER